VQGIFDHRSRGSGQGRSPETSQPAGMPVLSRTEYWSFLGVAVLLTLFVAAPQKWKETVPGQASTGAFGTKRSSDEPRIVQYSRAQQAGRGRSAIAPWQIPLRGWKDILWRTYKQIGEDRLLAVAAGIVFYGLLAFFPAITALVSFYGFFADPTTITQHLAAAGILPTGGLSIIQEQVTRLTANSGTKLSLGFAFGLALALWSANSGMKAIMDALNVVYEEKEKRGFIKLNLVSLAFTLAGLASIILAIGAVVVLPILLAHIGLSGVTDAIFRYGRWPVLIALVILGLAVIYRFGPSRREPQWKWLSAGSIFAAIAWLCSSALLSWYLSNFAHYDATYGSLGAAIGLMMWLWVSSIVLLFGAQLNSEIEHQTARDTTAERARPLGARGAVMADTVGEAT
jgi:membrane protein